VLVDISDVFNEKIEAVKCYPSQLAKFPDGYYESFNRAKAELRGVQGGCSKAEAFFEEPLAKNGPFYRTRSTKSLFD
jgi:LmbE family N-acetylglucosaminyl deacetylase